MGETRKALADTEQTHSQRPGMAVARHHGHVPAALGRRGMALAGIERAAEVGEPTFVRMHRFGPDPRITIPARGATQPHRQA